MLSRVAVVAISWTISHVDILRGCQSPSGRLSQSDVSVSTSPACRWRLGGLAGTVAPDPSWLATTGTVYSA